MTYAFRKNIHRRFHLQFKKSDEVNSSLQDVISGMRVVKSYGKEENERDKFNMLTDEFCRVQTKNEVFWAVFMPMVSLLMGAGVFLVIYFGGLDVLGGRMTTGELLQFVTYTQLLYMYLNWMTNMPRELMNLISSMERINDVLTQEPFVEDVQKPIHLDVEGEILVDACLIWLQIVSAGFGRFEPYDKERGNDWYCGRIRNRKVYDYQSDYASL